MKITMITGPDFTICKEFAKWMCPIEPVALSKLPVDVDVSSPLVLSIHSNDDAAELFKFARLITWKQLGIHKIPELVIIWEDKKVEKLLRHNVLTTWRSLMKNTEHQFTKIAVS